jgi:hypothetical protein
VNKPSQATSAGKQGRLKIRKSRVKRERAGSDGLSRQCPVDTCSAYSEFLGDIRRSVSRHLQGLHGLHVHRGLASLIHPPAALALAMPSYMTVFDDLPGNKLGVMAIPAALEGAGGQGGIRTHGELPPTTVFKTVALNHSATCPLTMRPLASALRDGKRR